MNDPRADVREKGAWLAGTGLQAPVDSVVVMEDRAQVTRKARVDLDEGLKVVHLAPVTPLVAGRTLRCRVRAASGGDKPAERPRVLDVGVRRRYLVQAARPEQEREITTAIEKLVDEYREDHDCMRVDLHERGQVRAAAGSLAGYMSQRLAVGAFDSKWPAEVSSLFKRREELEKSLLDVQNRQEDRLDKLERLHEEHEAALQPVPEYQAGLVCELQVATAGSYEIEWEYQVPCALWRPEYTAELAGGREERRVVWQSSGTVWQATGEDWQNVQISFSTARPTLGAELPLLDDDELESRPKTEQEKSVIEVTSRDQVIQKTTTLDQTRQSDTPPGLDDGGMERTFQVPERVDVPSDGRPHRLQYDAWESESRAEYACLPEGAQFVFLRSVQDNRSDKPLLAGPVSLLRSGGYVGRSKIGYIEAKEGFSLSWGSEDDMVVLRDSHRDFEQSRVRKRKTYTYKLRIYLVNYTGSPRRVKVTERVPVSEIEQVEVSVDREKTTPGFEQDDQGLVSWNLDMADGQEETVELVFAVAMPAKVVWQD